MAGDNNSDGTEGKEEYKRHHISTLKSVVDRLHDEAVNGEGVDLTQEEEEALISDVLSITSGRDVDTLQYVAIDSDCDGAWVCSDVITHTEDDGDLVDSMTVLVGKMNDLLRDIEEITGIDGLSGEVDL